MEIFGLHIDTRNANSDRTENTFFTSLFGGASRRTDYTALNLSAVFRAIDLISDSVATLPIITEFEETQNLFDNIVNLGRYEWLKLIVQSIIKNGQAFTYIERDSNRTPVRLLYLQHQEVIVNYDQITSKLYYTVTGRQGINNVQPQDMLHFRKLTFDGVNGRSILTFARLAIDIAQRTEDKANDYFDSNFKGLLKTAAQLTPQKQREIESNFEYFLKNKTAAVLSNGMQFDEIKGDNANDSQLIQAREYSVKDIARFFGIPQQLLTGEAGAYNSLEQAQQEFLTRTLQPYITLIEEELSTKLHEKINLNEGEMLRLSTAEKAQYINTLLSNGVLSINEAREELGLTRIDGGDRHIIAYSNIEDNTINNGQTTDGNNEENND